jgi:hypothetical protein
MREMAESIWEKMKANHAMSGFAVIITGIIITVFLWWFFGGLWFGELPGLAIMLIGVAEIFYISYEAFTDKRSTMLHLGLLVLFIGVASYLSFASHVMLGTLQIISLAGIVIGIILLAIGVISARKT